MEEIMNTSINDSSGSWGSAETIEYESSNIYNLIVNGKGKRKKRMLI